MSAQLTSNKKLIHIPVKIELHRYNTYAHFNHPRYPPSGKKAQEKSCRKNKHNGKINVEKESKMKRGKRMLNGEKSK